ncbi:MAG: hypothetical protein COB76_01200 [Alphaproteobacteria bacterium]|nr:MAG: hypothetical protein COB76_01200 [Alphaproteobacteria bacterium]
MKQKCNYCHQECKLIQAHIIPKGFLKGSESNSIKDKGFLEVSTEIHYTKNRPIGPYDQNILCATCDNIIGDYDGYAKTLLIDEISKYKDGRKPCYIFPSVQVDYTKLKKFFISLIWRASISKRDEYARVTLGPYEDIALKCLKDDIDLRDDIFSVLIFKDAPNIKYQDVISFTASKLAGKRAYKIHFSGYQITIVPKSIDMTWSIKNGTMSPADLFLKKDQALIIPEVDIDVSGKDQMIIKIYLKLRMKQ